MIDYSVVAKAIQHYQDFGYKYIEVPWLVSKKALLITMPLSVSIEQLKDSDEFVASGEQSFLQMIMDGLLVPGRYCCATPCYRPQDNLNDGLHFPTFFKVELINYLKHDIPLNEFKQVDLVTDMVAHAKNFMEQIRNKQELQVAKFLIDEERHACRTIYSFDLQTSGKYEIEVGSYGLRYCGYSDIGYWVYGTGVALPRIHYGVGE